MTSLIKYRLVIVFALIFSVIIISPRIIAIFSIPSADFNSIYPYFVEDELHYAARINAVLNNGVLTGNPYIFEHMNDMAIQANLPEAVVATIAILSGSSVSLAMLLSIFLFIFIDYILVYAIIFQNTRSKYLSILFTSIFFILFIQTFGRPISPQLNISLLLIAVYYLNFLLINRDGVNQKKVHAILGVLSGILLFVTPYYWTSILVLYGLVVMYRAYSERSAQILKNTFFNFLPYFLVFLVPFIYMSFISSGLSGYVDGSSRFGVIKTHFPGAWTNILLVFFTAISLYLTRKYIYKQSLVYSWVLLVSAVVLNWHNLITGIYFQFSSHYLVVTILCVIIVLSIVISSILSSDLSRNKKNLLIAPVIFILFFLFYSQKYEITLILNQKVNPVSFAELQEYSKVFDWLNSNTPKNSVVYSLGGEYKNLVPVYTHNKVYTNLYATIFPIKDREVSERWIINNIFNLDVNKEYILQSEKELWMNRYVDSYFYNRNKNKLLSLFGIGEETDMVRVPENEVQNTLYQYQNIKRMKLEEIFNMYNMDYIILDPKYSFYRETKLKLDNMSFVKKVATFDDTIVYIVNTKN